MFGRDRVTGEVAEDMIEAVNDIMKNDFTPTMNIDKDILNRKTPKTAPPPTNTEKDESVNVDQDSPFVCQPGGSAFTKKTKSKKRKATEDNTEGIVHILGTFLEDTQERLGEIAQCIGYDHDAKLS